MAWRPVHLIALIQGLALVGCTNSWEGPPHFLHVETFELETTESEGEPTSRIEEVWVYSETDVLGAFPLPADIPLDPESLGPTAELTFSAGIRANAISSTRQPYPFYDAKIVAFDLEYGGRDTVSFDIGYTDFTEVNVAEDFETANRFIAANTSTASIERTLDEQWILDGVGSGMIVLDDSRQTLVSETNEQEYNLKSNGPVWLELDYSCTQPFWIGLNVKNSAANQRTPILRLNSTSGVRNKIYLDLGPVVRSTPDATHYEITLDAYYDGSEDSTVVIVDNFKLLRYP
ncbi:MAG: hypothetical protein O2818_05265 [Bacteroidetes bacterium]|nr:hypothetical protein [Bacteroidota bacterium]MDA1336281.1 hypothetical protein [Bacteroidota bacterium]